MKYYSQINQDRHYIENVINFKKQGKFLDIGAHDGITISNTAALEFDLDWTGICVEPNTDLFNKLIINRPKSTNVNCAAWFIDAPLQLEIPQTNHRNISGDLLSKIDVIHSDKFREHFTDETVFQTVQGRTVTSIVEEYYQPPYHFDFLSLDVEGAEVFVLKGIDFTKIQIDYMTVEHGNVVRHLNNIGSLLKMNGFEIARVNDFDVEFKRIK